MRNLALTGLVAGLAFTLSQSARAADDPKAIVDKGIKALGGEEKLAGSKVGEMFESYRTAFNEASVKVDGSPASNLEFAFRSA